jgi:hypothetical protein
MRKWLANNRADIATVTQVVTAIFQIVAVVVAAIWTWRLSTVTGETIENPNVTVTAEVLPYDDTQRLLIVNMRPKNVGKAVIRYHPTDDMRITVKALTPGKAPGGLVDVDGLPVTFQTKNLFTKYGTAYELYPGIEFHESAAFVVQPGKYYVEGEIKDKQDDSTVGDQAFIEVR